MQLELVYQFTKFDGTKTKSNKNSNESGEINWHHNITFFVKKEEEDSINFIKDYIMLYKKLTVSISNYACKKKYL